MLRSHEPEILDSDTLPPEERERAHRALLLTHTLLGNRAAILRALRRDPLPVTRVLDVGCGHGALLDGIRRRLQVEAVGADLRPPPNPPFPIFEADVTRDPLPEADVAISLCLAHHLDDAGVIALIRNVRRSCRRFLLLDLVRSRLPLFLFRAAAPWVLPPVNVADGLQSIRRAFTPSEFAALVQSAAPDAAVRHHVAPGLIRQLADIRF